MRLLATAIALCVIAAGSLAGCAGGEPRQLLDARHAYREANANEAPQRASVELRAARAALADAERAFAQDGDDAYVLDLAYVAQRRAELAGARASLREAAEWKQRADRELAALSLPKPTPASGPPDLGARRGTSPGRIVFTLPTFEPGSKAPASTDDPTLTRFAQALALDPATTIVVEGHTDSVGDESWNRWLSDQRAKQVRDRLVELGVAEDRIQWRGMGGSQPVADNARAEGRAANRRVEIVVVR